MTYTDFPACLPGYAWLVKDAQTRPDVMFNDYPPHACKVCGEPTPRPAWPGHVREHVRQLALNARQREREAAARLRQINRLRAETRSVAPSAAPTFTPGAHLFNPDA